MFVITNSVVWCAYFAVRIDIWLGDLFVLFGYLGIAFCCCWVCLRCWCLVCVLIVAFCFWLFDWNGMSRY